MGCLKLTYQTTEPQLKVVHRRHSREEKCVQWFISVDPLWEEVGAHRSPYEYTYSNPIKFIDPNGMDPYLIMDGEKKSMSIYDDNNTPDDYSDDVYVGKYDAHNNVASSSKGKWEDGIYEMLDKNSRYTHPNKYEKDGSTLQDSSNGRYGEGGIYRAKSFKETKTNKTRSGMAVHAGRQYKKFLKRVTMGCWRTTPEGMEAIDAAIKKYGALTRIIVQNNRTSNNSEKVNKISPTSRSARRYSVRLYKKLLKLMERKKDNTNVRKYKVH